MAATRVICVLQLTVIESEFLQRVKGTVSQLDACTGYNVHPFDCIV